MGKRFRIPHGWEPRAYQKPAWNYWVRDGGKHLELVWHRRSGKDDLVLHGTCVKAFERVANYWHMLPLANQVRKAIWEAVNPRTGKRRIDEAFPPEVRETTREGEMFIRLKNGSTWQALGSDNFQGAIGSTPAGIVFSEWAQSNPSSRGYLRPILAENEGWQAYITTPRGKNHAYRTYNAAKKNDGVYAQLLTAEDTGIFGPEQLKAELQEYQDTYGEDMGNALFLQEYYCSFDAAIMGAYYGAELAALEQAGRICEVPHDPGYPVYTAWDIGRTDDTSIWWYQIIGGEIRIIDFLSVSGRDPDWFASQMLGRKVHINIVYGNVEVDITREDEPGAEHRQAYDYAQIALPHDAKARTFQAHGKSLQEQFAKVFGWDKVAIVPSLSFDDGIKAVRQVLKRMVFDADLCEDGIEALKQYRREWDDDKKCFKASHVHDWTSHPADAFRMLAVMWQEAKPKEDKSNKPVEGLEAMTLNQFNKKQNFNLFKPGGKQRQRI